MSEILDNLYRAVKNYNASDAEKWAKVAIAENIPPLEILNELTDTIRAIGDDFSKGILWLPDLVGAADALQAATPILEEALSKSGAKRETLGVVVLGTVFGDIHNIGKDMVSTLLAAEGFEVHDLGVNVPADEFIKAVDKYKADLLAMSALLTTTAQEQKKVIQNLKEMGLRDRVKVMVGGGPISQEFADKIGADGYDPTAPGAASLARKLLAVPRQEVKTKKQ